MTLEAHNAAAILEAIMDSGVQIDHEDSFPPSPFVSKSATAAVTTQSHNAVLIHGTIRA
ncbi:hypothetical protein DPMN_094047 [Dreissena polymorpha]|uniref:Uncharacterized protein n=1 Tax=Dreissena polymorpha TaxID=45954 RepID=A0A9D4JWH0_DREPO|nr:hypothetical protein DPMN_124742 [Dreissena polymorpha]KAH3851565.1 hypothetical protein DPMN_094047 [Dreissena polymorpha]